MHDCTLNTAGWRWSYRRLISLFIMRMNNTTMLTCRVCGTAVRWL